MLRIKDREYSGHVYTEGNEKLVAVIHSTDEYRDIAEYMIDVTSITEISEDGNEIQYTVTAPICARMISTNIYSFDFSTKPSYKQELENKIEEQNQLIDSLIVAFLEG